MARNGTAAVLVASALLGMGGPARAQLGGESLSLSATEVAGGTAVQATVFRLTHGCVTLPVTSSTTTLAPGTVTHPASVQVCQARASFTIATNPTPTPGDVRISVGTASQILRVRQPRSVSLLLEPGSAVGQGMPGTAATPIGATLSLEAPLSGAGCTSVYKQTSHPALARFDGQLGHPACLQGGIVSADRRTVSLRAEAYATSQLTPVTLSVRSAADASTSAAVLTVRPLGLGSLELDRPDLGAGESATLRVRLDGRAGSGGALVALASSDPARVAVLASVLIPAGESELELALSPGPSSGCGERVVLSASFAGSTRAAELRLSSSEVLPHPSVNGSLPWSGRSPVASGPALLWSDLSDVYFDEGAGAELVQAKVDAAGNDLGNVADFVMALGEDPAAGGYLGLWRRNEFDAWIWRSATDQLLRVDTSNPFDPADDELSNPEHAGISGSCAFLSLQVFDPDDNRASQQMFLARPADVDPATGLIPVTALDGLDLATRASRVAADPSGGCRAAWLLEHRDGDQIVAQELHYFDGTSLRSLPLGAGDGAAGESVRVSGSRIAWAQEDASGISQIRWIEMSAANPQPVQVTQASAGQGCFRPALDGRHLAFLCGNADGSDLDVTLRGGLVVSDAGSRAQMPNVAVQPLQLAGEQLLWQDAGGGLQHFRAGARQALCSDPAAPESTPGNSRRFPWLTADQIVWQGRRLGAADVTDPIVAFRLRSAPAVTPSDPPAPLALEVVPGDGQLTLRWEQLLGVQGYNVYLSQDPGVGPASFERRVSGAQSPLVIPGLANLTRYHLTVTAVAGGIEGAAARPALGVPGLWKPASASSAPFHALAADALNPATLYAAGNSTVYRSSDSGQSFAPLSGGIAGRDVRALAARGSRVLAVTRDGDVLRSENSGASWDVVADGADYGMSSHAIAIDPASPGVIYAGNLKLDDEFPGVYRSTQGGAAGSWARVNAPELLASALAIHPAAGTVYAGGSGSPFLARSADGGASWNALSLQAGIHALVLDPSEPATLYAGTASGGVQRSADGGATWSARSAGLPGADLFRSLALDPALPGVAFVATSQGVYHSADSGLAWAPAGVGLAAGASEVRALAISGRRLLAATLAGLHALELAAAPDRDADGIPDALDRCPAFATADQSDSDGDGTGNACECGDQNGDGTVSVLDLVAINAAVFNPALATPLCDANGDGRCAVQDVVAANAAIFGAPAYCARNPRP